jgi:hypothetical protein
MKLHGAADVISELSKKRFQSHAAKFFEVARLIIADHKKILNFKRGFKACEKFVSNKLSIFRFFSFYSLKNAAPLSKNTVVTPIGPKSNKLAFALLEQCLLANIHLKIEAGFSVLKENKIVLGDNSRLTSPAVEPAQRPEPLPHRPAVKVHQRQHQHS